MKNEGDKNIDCDSLNWGSASKGTAKKVYGNLAKKPFEMAMKVEIANILDGLALGVKDMTTISNQISEIHKKYDEKVKVEYERLSKRE